MTNITFISGTPCTGKTTIAEALSSKLNIKLIKINDFAIDNELILGIDNKKGYKIIDVEKLDALLLKTLEKHDSIIVEGHLSHLCSGADKLIILRCNPEILEKRLTERNYSKSKIFENLEAEAMGVCTAEALEKYSDEIHEIDVSDLTTDECVLKITNIINNNEKLNFGEINFMDWILTRHQTHKL